MIHEQVRLIRELVGYVQPPNGERVYGSELHLLHKPLPTHPR